MENIEPAVPSHEENHIFREEILDAKKSYERLAGRLDYLLMKEMNEGPLSKSEKKEIDLIFNNAMVAEEIINGKMPEEFRQ